MRVLARLFGLICLLAMLAAALLLWQRQLAPVPPPSLPPLSGPIELIRIEKAARRMTLWQDGVAQRSYRIALGFAPTGDKQRQGDGKTPEGRFHIDRRNENSAFTLSLGLNYPRPQDQARAKAGGYDPGGDIMIHGQPNQLPDEYLVKGDWTLGCVAISNAQMREIWPHIPIGTAVEILP